jgi:hypothetical protein
MTSNDVAELKLWIDERLQTQTAMIEKHGARLDIIEGQVTKMDATYAQIERLADAMETTSAFINRGKKFWVTFASFITATLVIIDLVARSIPKIPWP